MGSRLFRAGKGQANLFINVTHLNHLFHHRSYLFSPLFMRRRTKDRPILYLKRNVLLITSNTACDQALRGPLVAGREKEEEFPTTSVEFKYLHRNRRCEILIGGDDISNDVITLGTCFSMFVNIRPFFRFALIENLKAQSTRGATGGWNSYSRDVVASSPSFSCPATRVPSRTCSQAI